MTASLLAARTGQIQLPVFREIAALAAQHKAINLAGGTPDFPAPAVVKHAAAQAIEADLNQYALSHGVKELREGIAARIQQEHRISVDPDTEITVCCGSTEAMTAALLAVINPGDEVIIIEPAFTIYAPGVILCGGRPVPVKLEAPEFKLDPGLLEQVVSSRTKAVIFNSPHNPTGRVFSKEEVAGVAEVCLKYNLVALTDEIYDEIFFDGLAPVRLWALPGMRERTILINGLSKTYSITGWRLGYVVAPPVFTQAIKITHNYLSLSAPAPLQTAAVTAVDLPQSYYEELRRTYQERRDLLLAGLNRLGFSCLNPEGSYFIIARFNQFSRQDDLAFARFLVKQVGVAAVPVSGFYTQPEPQDRSFLRFAFCKQAETLVAALERLQQLAGKEGN